jgi:hypothetical protein
MAAMKLAENNKRNVMKSVKIRRNGGWRNVAKTSAYSHQRISGGSSGNQRRK